jgi:hypothetical protein
MKTRTAIFVAVSVALGLASPALFAQGQKPAVTNPSAAKAKKQADGADDLLAGRKGAPGTAKQGTTQKGSGQGQQVSGQRKAQAMNDPGQGQGGPGSVQSRQKSQAMSDPGQGQGGPGSVQSRQKSQMQGQGGQAGGGEQFHKGNQMKGAASAKGAASSKAAQMHK